MAPVPSLALPSAKDIFTSVIQNPDTKALVLTTIAMVSYVEFVKLLAARRVFTSVDARKIMHIGAGPVFVLCWPLFSSSPNAGKIAALAPFGMTMLFTAVALGIVKDEATVKSMSRTGDKLELLKGPFAYGTVISAGTVLLWRRLGSVIGVSALCAGDGFADVIGRRFGRKKIPWSPRKSWAGTAGFIGASTAVGLLFGLFFGRLGWTSDVSASLLVRRVVIANIAAALVETLPVQDWDNYTVFLTAIGVDSLVCRAANARQ